MSKASIDVVAFLQAVAETGITNPGLRFTLETDPRAADTLRIEAYGGHPKASGITLSCDTRVDVGTIDLARFDLVAAQLDRILEELAKRARGRALY